MRRANSQINGRLNPRGWRFGPTSAVQRNRCCGSVVCRRRSRHAPDDAALVRNASAVQMTTDPEDFRHPPVIQDRAAQCLDVAPAHLRRPHCRLLCEITNPTPASANAKPGLRSRCACSVSAARSRSSMRHSHWNSCFWKIWEHPLSGGTKNRTVSRSRPGMQFPSS